MHADLAAHERSLTNLLATYRGPYYADWCDELRRAHATLAELARGGDPERRSILRTADPRTIHPPSPLRTVSRHKTERLHGHHRAKRAG